jgi:hypothetical protein
VLVPEVIDHRAVPHRWQASESPTVAHAVAADARIFGKGP